MEKIDEPTALIIEHTVKKGNEDRYEKWLAEILEATKKKSGYIGREIFPPNGSNKPYISIVRFQKHNDLQNWVDSAERKEFIGKVQEILANGDKTSIKAGIDVWFTPDNAPNKPPAYKQFLITLAAIYPLTLIIPLLVSPFSESIPVLKNPYLGGFVITVIIVGLMTYLIMPNVTHWLHSWLFKPPQK